MSEKSPHEPPPVYDADAHRKQPRISSSEEDTSAYTKSNNTNSGYYRSGENAAQQTPYHFRQDKYYYDLNAPGDTAPIKNFEDAFPTENDNKPKFNDWPFTILFLLTLFGFITIAGLTLRSWSKNYSANGSGIYNSNYTGTMDTNAAILLVFATAIALFFSIVGFILFKTYPKFFIYCGMIVNILAALGTAIMYMSLKYWSAGIVFLVFTFLTAFCYWGMRSRIPLTVTIAKIIAHAMKAVPQTLFITLLGTVVTTAFAMLFSVVVVAVYMKYDPSSQNPGCDINGGKCSHSKLVGVLVVTFFCGYYITEVLRNVIHCTTSGVFGSWYYMYKSDQGMPRWPAFGAFKRSMTYSFGSICFGSLIVSIIETIRQGFNLLRQSLSSGQVGGNWSQILLIVVNWIIGFIQWLAEYFNHYAYTFIALYGKPYLKSAKQTWYMFRQKGMDALINDNLLNIALGFYCTFCSYMTTLFAFLFLRFTNPNYNYRGDFNAPLMAFSFVIALQITNIAGETIRSGAATFFVGLGNDPEVYQASYPESFDEVFHNYPDVLNKLNHQNV